MPDSDFRTFCHISEYGVHGYGNLHRMIAASRPLVLWAPSTALLSDPGCQVSPKTFIELVEKGAIRVHGREEWITSERTRNDHVWSGAAWTPGVDDVISKMAEEDKTKPAEARRVYIAPPAQGDEQARKYVDENPKLVRMVNREMTRGGGIPPGVAETAYRLASEPRKIAEAVFGQAFNHAEAYRESGAAAPFFLANSDSRFLKWMADVHPSHSGVEREKKLEQKLNSNYAELARQLVDVLRTLELSGNEQSVAEFVNTEEHRQLSSWMFAMCSAVAVEKPESLDRKIHRELARQLEIAELKNNFRSWIKRPFDPLTFTSSTAVTAGGLVFDGITPYAIAGAMFGALPVGKGVLMRLGYIPAEYSGPQWPFIYAFGKPASGKRVKKLRRALRLTNPNNVS